MNEVLIGWLMLAPNVPDLPTLEDLYSPPAWYRSAACAPGQARASKIPRGDSLQTWWRLRGQP
jgi:hypothetical protein